ncbi:hypothetical protein [Leptolyngbya ohadii]|uniref:hypothetical protein n=1 Tax=Leptolyngbya ohadii TaxID=1962290 RepID=UPI000B59ED28|nr:hypothetical protein [Leptolyngbya ohadii]
MLPADPFSYTFPIVYSKPDSAKAQSLDERYGMSAIPAWVKQMQQAWMEQRPGSLSDEMPFDFGAHLPEAGNA